MAEYSKVDLKLTNTQLKKLKTVFKNKTGIRDLPHELFLTTRQTKSYEIHLITICQLT